MKNGRMILTLALLAAGMAWAQDEQTPAPAPAFGQENPAPPVAENPPISAIDQPGLSPHAAPESFLMYGLHFSESADSNVGNQLGGSAVSSVTRGLGSVTLQKLWQNYDVAMDYIGGVAYYDQQGFGLQQIEQLDLDNRINWKRGQLAIRDSFTYLPEGVFGFGAYGGGGAYNSSLGSLGTGLLGGGAFGGQSSAFFGTNTISVGQAPRITNLGLADVVESLTPNSAITLAAGYGVVHFYGDLFSIAGSDENISFIGSSELTGQVAYNRILTPKDQAAVSYGYQTFDFSTVDTKLHTNVIQLLYGHRVTGRLDLLVSAGPQFIHFSSDQLVCEVGNLIVPGLSATQCQNVGGSFNPVPETANHIGLAGRISLRYRFPKTSVSLSFQRYTTSGDGVFAGSLTETGHLDVQRPLSRVWDVFADLGFSKNHRLQFTGSSVNAASFTYGYAGIGLHRQLGRPLRAFVSYQFNGMGFDSSCPVPGTGLPFSTAPCSNYSQRQVGTIGLDWTPRPRRLE